MGSSTLHWSTGKKQDMSSYSHFIFKCINDCVLIVMDSWIRVSAHVICHLWYNIQIGMSVQQMVTCCVHSSRCPKARVWVPQHKSVISTAFPIIARHCENMQFKYVCIDGSTDYNVYFLLTQQNRLVSGSWRSNSGGGR